MKIQLSRHLVLVNGTIEFQTNDPERAHLVALDVASRLFNGGNIASVLSVKAVDALRLGILKTDAVTA